MRIESSVVIKRPIDEIWAFLADPFNIPRWRTDRLAARVTPPGPVGVGSIFQLRIVFFAWEIQLTYTVTEWEPPHAFTWALRTPPWMASSNYERLTLEATVDGTKFVRALQFEPGPILKLLLQIGGPYVRRRIDGQNQTLKRVLESGRG